MPCLIGACNTEVLIRAALSFGGDSHVPDGNADVERIYIVRPAPKKVSSSRRRLLDAKTLMEDKEAWQLAESTNGQKHWFRPSSAIAIEWISLTKSRLLAIPLPGIAGMPVGYLLRLISRNGQGSHYARVLTELGVQWQNGSSIVPVLKQNVEQ